MQARLCWAIKGTRTEGHGKWLDRPVVEAWVEHANKEWPDILHWIELKARHT
jgi:hypothetical protein